MEHLRASETHVRVMEHQQHATPEDINGQGEGMRTAEGSGKPNTEPLKNDTASQGDVT